MARYALVAGIAKYSNPLLPPLSKTATDAVAVAEVLKQYGSYRVTLLNGEVTAKQLADALRTLLLEQAVKNEALIYFTGHGIMGVTGVDSLEQPQGYLAASDCNVTKAGEQWIVRGGGVSLNGLNQVIRQSDLSNLVVIFDSCHSGEFLERGLVENALTVFRSRQDYYLIAACRRFEQSWAKKSEQHSVFTGALLAGLSQERAGDNGQVTVDRLFDSIASELSHSRQEPIRMGVGRSLTLVQYPPKKTTVIVDETCPYQGLQAFGKEQARFFFGREKVIQLLMEKLEQANFVPIIGASGSGKSSVVRAGLIPQLEKNGWRVLEPILPGDEPLAELKTVLIELFGRTEGREVYSLVKTDGLRPVVERLSGSERLLLVVDQFEEVFTLCPKEEERRQFIELLTQVAEIPTSRLVIVTMMRADFLEEWLRYPSLTQLIQDREVWLGSSLEWSDLEQAIVKPAELKGYRFEEGLLGAILHDVDKEQGCLPLLQFALTELWEKRNATQHQLTVDQYRAMGGVIGSLDRHAEDIYESFNQQEQEWIKRIFLKLVRTSEGVRDTKQRQPKAKLLALAGDNVQDRQAISNVLDELIRGHLLVSGEEGVDLAHEALMEGWKRFDEWRQENQELRRLRDRLEDALREWQKNPQDENLIMGGLLAQVREKWLELKPDLDAAAKQFYHHSDADDKSRSRVLTLHRLLEQAARVENLLSIRPLDGLVEAIQLMGENLEKMPKQILKPVQTNLQRAIQADKELSIFQGNEGTVYSVAFSPDGQMIVSGSGYSTVRLWDIHGSPIGQPFKGHGTGVWSIAFSPDGQMIASGSDTVRLWDIYGNPIGQPLEGHEKGVNSVAFSPNGQMIVSGGADKTVRLWDIQGNPIGQPFQGHEDEVNSVAFSPDGRMIVSGGMDKTVRLWDIQGNPIGQPFQGHESAIWSITFSPDGQMIVSSSSDNTVRLWDIQGNPIGQPFQGHEDAVLSVAFSPDGQMIVSGGEDSTVRLWDIQGNPLGQAFQGHEDSVTSVTFSPDGQIIASGSYDKTVRLWLVGSWEALFKAACNRLRNYPVFKNPQTEIEKQACETCRKYVWDK